jgi:homeobox protein CDX
MIFILGKTRTRDKYRIVYTDRQRYELENEFLISKYISIPRKAALSSALSLSERQVSEKNSEELF